jgi:hypothetical protein
LEENDPRSRNAELAHIEFAARTSEKGDRMNSGEPSGHRENDHLKNRRDNNSQHSSHQANDQTTSLEEARKIRRLQIMIGMVSSVISQDPSLTIEEASELAAGAKRAALAMFPDKELAYDLLYKPRLQRLMCERFHLQ